MNKNKLRFALSGLSDMRSNKVGLMDDNMVGEERHPTRWAEDHIRFVQLLSDADTFTVVDLAFWWTVDERMVETDLLRAPRTDVKPMADRLVRILISEHCIYVDYERSDVVRFGKSPAFQEFLEQILRIEEHLLDLAD